MRYNYLTIYKVLYWGKEYLGTAQEIGNKIGYDAGWIRQVCRGWNSDDLTVWEYAHIPNCLLYEEGTRIKGRKQKGKRHYWKDVIKPEYLL